MKTLFYLIIFSFCCFTFNACDKDDSDELTTVNLTKVFPKDQDHADRCTSATGLSEEDLSGVSATLSVKQENGRTTGNITFSKGMANTVYTIWIRLDGLSPLTGKPSTPLANPSDLAGMAPHTIDEVITDEARALGWSGNDGTGSDDLSVLKNAFQTDAAGNAVFDINLDFELFGGNYPYNQVDSNFSSVKINDDGTSEERIISIVSHCNTNKGYGLVGKTAAVPNEGWFDLLDLPF